MCVSPERPVEWDRSRFVPLLAPSVFSAAPSLEVTPLARALRFGRHAGAVAQLCRHGMMDQASAVQSLAGAGFTGPQVERIWDRLVRAYVHP